jgi:hypothetical protein
MPDATASRKRQIAGGMPEQDLDHTNIDVLLEQVRGEA